LATLAGQARQGRRHCRASAGVTFVFMDIPGLFRKKALSSQLSAVSLQRVEELRVEESRFLDFLTLSFVFIDIPASLRRF